MNVELKCHLLQVYNITCTSRSVPGCEGRGQSAVQVVQVVI